MIEVAFLREQEKVKFLQKEVQEKIKEILQALDAQYGADRNKYEDDGGYVVVIEKKEDIAEVDDFLCIDLETEATPEFVDLIKCEQNGEIYTNSLILSNNEFGVSIIMPLEITPDNLKEYIAE